MENGILNKDTSLKCGVPPNIITTWVEVFKGFGRQLSDVNN